MRTFLTIFLVMGCITLCLSTLAFFGIPTKRTTPILIMHTKSFVTSLFSVIVLGWALKRN